MPTGFRVYSSKQVKVSVAGIPIEGGFADGEFVRIARESMAFSDVVGTGGEVTRNKTNDNRADAFIILMMGGQHNAQLSQLLNNDKNSEGGSGVGRWLVEDLNGTSVHEAAQCWIAGDPDISYDREVTALEWPIRIATLISSHGGYF